MLYFITINMKKVHWGKVYNPNSARYLFIAENGNLLRPLLPLNLPSSPFQVPYIALSTRLSEHWMLTSWVYTVIWTSRIHWTVCIHKSNLQRNVCCDWLHFRPMKTRTILVLSCLFWTHHTSTTRRRKPLWFVTFDIYWAVRCEPRFIFTKKEIIFSKERRKCRSRESQVNSTMCRTIEKRMDDRPGNHWDIFFLLYNYYRQAQWIWKKNAQWVKVYDSNILPQNKIKEQLIF